LSELKLVDDGGWCFACGENNPIGLKLKFEKLDGNYIAKFTPQKEHQGYEGITHGGIVSTLLDEAMARFAWAEGYSTVTAEMTVRFKRPARTGVELTLTGKITGEERRTVLCMAQATDPDGNVVAEATARLVKV
jgi:uncharacterized protein (TIGR00369 family)